MSVSGQPAATYVKYVGSRTNTHCLHTFAHHMCRRLCSVRQPHMTLHEIDVCMSKFSPSNCSPRDSLSIPGHKYLYITYTHHVSTCRHVKIHIFHDKPALYTSNLIFYEFDCDNVYITVFL